MISLLLITAYHRNMNGAVLWTIRAKYNAELVLHVHRIKEFKRTWTNTSPLRIHLHCCYPGSAKILSTNSQLSGIPGSQLHPGMPVQFSRNSQTYKHTLHINKKGEKHVELMKRIKIHIKFWFYV